MNIYIYKLISPSNKSYIGVSKNPKKRFKGHSIHLSSYIGKAIRKYGKGNFKLEILDNAEEYSEAYLLEQKYIKKFNTICPNGYNLDSGGQGGREVSEKTRKKMCKAQEGRTLSKEHRRKIGQAHKGKIISQEMIEKLQKFFTGRKRPSEVGEKISKSSKGRTLSKEHRRKIGEAHGGKKQSKETVQKRVETRKENAKAHGYWHSRETKEKMRKLTNEQVEVVFHAFYDGYYTAREIAEAFKVGVDVVYAIIKGKYYGTEFTKRE